MRFNKYWRFNKLWHDFCSQYIMMKEKTYKPKFINNSVRYRTLLTKGSNWQENLQVGSNRVNKIQLKLGGEL